MMLRRRRLRHIRKLAVVVLVLMAAMFGMADGRLITVMPYAYDGGLSAPALAPAPGFSVFLPQIQRGSNNTGNEPAGGIPTNTPSITPTAVPATPPPASTPTSVPATTPTPAPSPVQLGTGSRLGIWAGSTNATMTARLKDSGAKWTRIMVFWSEIEPTNTEPPTYDFSEWDGVFSSLNQAGIIPIAEIRWNPTWAATTLCGPIDKQGGMAAFDRFVKALVQRYKAAPYNVTNWEFYNEPDNTQTTGQQSEYCACFGDYPTEYVDLLRTGYSAVKSVDPDAKVLIGGLAFQNQSPFNVNFLDQVLAAGAGPYFDVMNIHYYSSQEPAWMAYGTDIGGKVTAARQVMDRYGINKPVAVTETSWTSSDPRASDFTEKQARYVPKVLARSLAFDLYALIWFSLADWNGADVTYGLTDVNLNPKLSFQAYQIASNEFGDAASVRGLLPSEVGVSAMVEGYSFSVNGQERWVLWAQGNPQQVVIPARASSAKNKLGQTIPLSGGGSTTTITLDDSPIYVQF